MDATEITKTGNSLRAKVVVSNCASYKSYAINTPEFVINDAAVFQLRRSTVVLNEVPNNLLFVRFTKLRVTDDLIYYIHFTSAELKIRYKTFTSDDGTWHLIFENKVKNFSFNVAVEMHLMPSVFTSLHGDTELTDFELRGEDGSVRVHRTVLAAASPVFRRMLVGAWRETAEGHVDVTGTSQTTLEHLKTYMYLHRLPEEGLEQLLLLSSYYMMPEMEQRCVVRLLHGANGKKVCELNELAIKHNVKRLLLAILESVQNGAISISEIRNHLAESESTNESK